VKHAVIAAAALAVLGAAGPALAHHSRSNFALDQVIEMEGVVTEYAFRNPHAFVVVAVEEAPGETHEWTFEMNSTPVLARFGTTRDSLQVGDHVVARGNPDRNAERRFVYANVFVKDDGSEVWSWGRLNAPAPGTPPPGAAPAPAQVAGSTDFVGVWRIQFQAGFDVLGADRPDTELVTSLPVNEKGAAQVAAFDPDQNPEWDCLPQSIPTILGHPYPFEIIRDDANTLRLLYEVNHVERIIHLGETEHPVGVAPTPTGHSIGRIEADGALAIETARFSDVRWGAGEGVDSGQQKTTREIYRLVEDGRHLELTVTMEDPEYLTEPVTITHRYNLTLGYEIQDYVCDPATSRRHLTAGVDE
jgi:hypothetical protein